MRLKPSPKFASLAFAFAVILACSGNETSQGGFYVADRCRVDVGDELLLTTLSTYPNGASVTIDGKPATVLGQISGRIRVSVPPGVSAGTGKRVVVRNGAVEVGAGTVTIGATNPTTETEPNDNVDGLDATFVRDMNWEATGALSSFADKDHFEFDCIAHSIEYEIFVSPPGAGQVFVNGQAVTLDGTGKGTFRNASANDKCLVGITGGTGNYTITLRGKL